jgi:hypothetical protein
MVRPLPWGTGIAVWSSGLAVQPPRPPSVQHPGVGGYSPAPGPLRPGAQLGAAPAGLEEAFQPPGPGDEGGSESEVALGF